MKQAASGLLINKSEITMEMLREQLNILTTRISALEQENNGLKETIENNLAYTTAQLSERDEKITELIEGSDALFSVLKNHSEVIKSYLGE